MKIIDTHCHFVPEIYINALKQYNRLYEDGFPVPEWSEEMHLKYMKQTGITHAVLSLSSPHPWFNDRRFSAHLCRQINIYASELCQKYPDLFSFAACLPLPDVELAVQEAVYCLDQLGACAIKLASQSDGQYLGDPVLDPLMQELNRRQTVIIIHPSSPKSVPSGCFTSGPLPLLEFIADTTRAVINLITTGTLERYSDIRIVVPHCGSFLPNLIDRLCGITRLFETKGIGRAVHVEKSLQSIYFDIAGDAFPRGFRILQTLTDTDHILFGGDFPYTPDYMISEKINDLKTLKLSEKSLKKICFDNAANLFRLKI